MCFDYLLLGHLLGDFTFQTDRIAQNKIKQWNWNLYHSIIVTCCMFIFSIPFGSTVIWLVLLNGLFHFVIDFYKSRLPDRGPIFSLIYFAADQTIHILIILFISTFYIGNDFLLPINKRIMDFLIVLVFMSSFASILIQYLLRLVFVSYSDSFFIKNEKNAGILTRTLIFLILILSKYFSGLILLTVIAVLTAKIAYYKKKWYSAMSTGYFYTGLLMDIIIPIFLFYFILER